MTFRAICSTPEQPEHHEVLHEHVLRMWPESGAFRLSCWLFGRSEHAPQTCEVRMDLRTIISWEIVA